MLYDIPSLLSDATIAVSISPAPFANAIKVTPAKDSESFKVSQRKTIAGATYSSITSQINLKMIIIRRMNNNITRILEPFKLQK